MPEFLKTTFPKRGFLFLVCRLNVYFLKHLHLLITLVCLNLFYASVIIPPIISSRKMIPNKTTRIDIINELLEECILAYPVSSFVISIYKQYQQRGSLSKKQLQGLHGKACKINTLAPGRLATLEALINKMPTRYKSDKPGATPLYQKDEVATQLLQDILHKYPQHKRVLFLKAKYDNNELLSPFEIDELKKFKQLLK